MERYVEIWIKGEMISRSIVPDQESVFWTKDILIYVLRSMMVDFTICWFDTNQMEKFETLNFEE